MAIRRHITALFASAALFASPAMAKAPVPAPAKPNVLIILMDNLGYGELGVYGGGVLRGAPTPRIDRLAGEGLRLTNFNVEAQCSPSRAALMTGRYAIRSGNPTVPISTPRYGLVQWEVTLADMLSDAGYATGAFGKWHLGQTAGRFPTDQGFDEWYGIPNSSDESNWPDNPMYRADANPDAGFEYVMEGRKGQPPRKLAVYDHEQRRLIDRALTEHAVDFMQRQTKAGKPFFAYVPFTMPHYPMLPDPAFDGKSGNGVWGDTLMQIDAFTGQLLDSLDKMGVANNTIVIFASDNGPEFVEPWTGSAGPWRGSYFTGLEGSLRVPFIMRWPGHVPAGRTSNDIVHEMDVFPTLARIAGGQVPDDRIIDGVDQSGFLTGAQEKSARDGFVVYVGNDIYGVKWRDWKMATKEVDRGDGVVKQFSVPHLYNLNLDPREERPLTNALENYWARYPIFQILLDHMASLKKSPPIQPGQADPYTPPAN